MAASVQPQRGAAGEKARPPTAGGPPRPLQLLSRAVLAAAVASAPGARAMNPDECRSLSSAGGSVKKATYANQLFPIVLHSSANLGDWETNNIRHVHFSPDTDTSGQAIYTRITDDAYACLTNKLRPGGDNGFLLNLFREVPFVCHGTIPEHFAYSGDCTDKGCVYTGKCIDLIKELGGSWLLHEYGHVYHLALDEKNMAIPEIKALQDAYDAAVARKTAIMNSHSGQHFDDYAFSNFKEYFAVLTEAVCHNSPNTTYSNHWPANIEMLTTDDPDGKAAVLGLWRMSKADQEKYAAQCEGGSSRAAPRGAAAGWGALALALAALPDLLAAFGRPGA